MQQQCYSHVHSTKILEVTMQVITFTSKKMSTKFGHLCSSTARTTTAHIQWFSTHALPQKRRQAVLEALKSYEEIPREKGLPFIGTALDYIKGENAYKMSKVLKQRYDKFGAIFREKMFPGSPEQVIICNPQDIETVFRADGAWPHRQDGGELFEKIRNQSGLSTGLANAQGEHWQRLRQPIQKFAMMPKKVGEYHEEFNAISHDLLENIHQTRDPESKLVVDIPDLLFKWSFESIFYFMLGKRLGALNTNGDLPLDCKEFIEQVGNIFQSLPDLLFSVPLYRLYPTKNWKAVVSSHTAVRKLATKFIEEKMKEIEEGYKVMLANNQGVPDKVDFLTYLLHAPGRITPHEITGNVIDLLGAGVDTTSYTLGWTLYCLATNPEAQEKLRSEVQQVVGSEKIVTPAHINQMSYLRNSIRETTRLYPLPGFNRRKLQKDIVLSGYKVPRGTEIIMPLTITGRVPELFHDPDCFVPERWSKENKDTLPNMFSSLPFGFGPRMCVGRRVAELEMHIALAHVMNHFRVEYPDKEPMGYIQKFLVIPERQLNLTFKDV